jgi:hypothetical protein
MQLSPCDLDLLQRLEEDLWRPEVRFARARIERLIAPDFFEYGRSGRAYSREDILAAKPEHFEAQLPLRDFDARLLALDTAQLTYNSAVRYDGEWLLSRRSSIWTRDGGGWRLRFHQATPYDGDA